MHARVHACTQLCKHESDLAVALARQLELETVGKRDSQGGDCHGGIAQQRQPSLQRYQEAEVHTSASASREPPDPGKGDPLESKREQLYQTDTKQTYCH